MQRRIARLTVSSVLLVAVSACGTDSTSAKDADLSPTSRPAASTAATDSDAVATTDQGEFCQLLAKQGQEATELAAAVGTADESAALERIAASNRRIADAAPAEISDAFAVITEVAAASRKALTSDDPSAASDVAELSTSAEAKQAFSDYRAWLTDNCPDLAGQLLPPDA